MDLSRGSKIRGSAIALVILGCLVGLWLLYGQEAQEADVAIEKADTAVEEKEQVEDVARPLVRQVLRICRGKGQAAKELRKGGACPLANDATEVIEGPPGPQGEPGEPGEQGETGPPPSDAQVLRAVQRYCAISGCRGPAGRSVTPSEVATAVAAFCNANGRCQGPQGVQGAPGSTGPTGPAGPPPTSAQISAAVSTYCAENNCRGPAGPPGPKGDPGTVVTGFTCQETQDGVTLTLKFSNAPSVTVPLTVDPLLLGQIGCG